MIMLIFAAAAADFHFRHDAFAFRHFAIYACHAADIFRCFRC